MGYTHYWTFKKPRAVKGNADKAEIAYQKAVKACTKIAQAWNKLNVKGSENDFKRLAGFTAHTSKYGGIELNGKGEDGHETFSMREHFRQNFEEPINYGGLCKTAQKPYDTVIVACLAVFKYYLGDLIDVSSDGRAIEWFEGVNLARRVTKLDVKNPLFEEPKKITVNLRRLNNTGETFIELKELEKFIVENADNFPTRSLERLTLLVLVDKVKGLGA